MLTLIVVVGSVMAYGAVAVLFLPMNRSNALSMVFMVVPMTVLMFVSLRFVLRKIQGRMDLLTDALGQVAGGNLSVRLDEANAGEYAAVYSDFNHMVEELQRTKDEMMQFTNDFAHEFKTPLTSVKGFADYLYETGGGIESKERMEYLKVIAEQSGRLSLPDSGPPDMVQYGRADPQVFHHAEPRNGAEASDSGPARRFRFLFLWE